MNNFKIGDRVEYVRIDSRAVEALVGRRGTVTGITGDGIVEVHWSGHSQPSAHSPEFVRPLPDAEQPEMPPPLAEKSVLPHDSAERKTYPLYSVLFGYFPAAMAELAKHSYESNEKHNPGEELHWSRGKSDDHADAALRHLVEGDYRGLLWRAAALLQLELEGEGYPKAPLAR